MKTINTAQLIEWMAGFGAASGHFVSEEACADFVKQVEGFLADDQTCEQGSLEHVRRNLIHVQELDELMALDDRKYEKQFHMALIAYAEARANSVTDELHLAILDDFGLRRIARTPVEEENLYDCMDAYYELTRKDVRV